MTRSQAIAKARKMAKKLEDFVFIVFECGEWDVATDHDLDTFWLGAEPVMSVAPDGGLEQ
jgi:hypothetical protein